jgi:glycosyltransferase involved in cell wall biosynthesis
VRVAILLPAAVPAVVGGAERLAEGLRDAIRARPGDDAEVVTLPIREHRTSDLLLSYRSWRTVDLSSFDAVISTKYPTWMVDHPRHVVYLFHVLRGLYDTYHLFEQPKAVRWHEVDDRRLQELVESTPDPDAIDEVLDRAITVCDGVGDDDPLVQFPGAFVRAIVHWLDGAGMSPRRIERHAAISGTVMRREGYFPPRTPVTVAYPPASLSGSPAADGAPSHLFAVSRLDAPKRFDLLLDAMAKVESDVQLKIAGTGPEREALESKAATDPRVQLLGFVEDRELRDLYAHAIAVPFLPLDEDFGLITVEAAGFSKPVITCADSGGPAELVVPGRTGIVVPRSAEAIAEGIDAMVRSPETAAAMGRRAHQHLGAITWEATVSALLDPAPANPVAAPRRKRSKRLVTVVSTFPVHPRIGGGQLRSAHMSGALSPTFDLEIQSLGGE